MNKHEFGIPYDTKQLKNKELLEKMNHLKKMIEEQRVKPCIIIGNYTINKLQAGETIHLSNAVLIPDDELMNKAQKKKVKREYKYPFTKEWYKSMDRVEKTFKNLLKKGKK